MEEVQPLASASASNDGSDVENNKVNFQLSLSQIVYSTEEPQANQTLYRNKKLQKNRTLLKLAKRFKVFLGKEEVSVQSGSLLHDSGPHTFVCSL